jgi:hypothetical protein
VKHPRRSHRNSAAKLFHVKQNPHPFANLSESIFHLKQLQKSTTFCPVPRETS